VAAWLLLSLISMALVGSADLLVRRVTLLGVRPASFMVVQSWFFGPTALLWGLATARLAWSRTALLGLVAGVLASLATYAFLRSLQAPGSQVSVNAAIYRLNLAGAALLAIALLGETATPARVAGLVLAVAAILLLADTGGAISTGGIGWAVLATIALGLVLLLSPHPSPIPDAAEASGPPT
jgi:uncharacterized membrane protein